MRLQRSTPFENQRRGNTFALSLAVVGAVATLSTACQALGGNGDDRDTVQVAAAGIPPGLAAATFAGGCFWCMETPFEKLPGVSAAISGYAGGPEHNPSYRQVASGRTGHAEVVQIHYDPAKISYADLLQVFWRQIDPTDAGGQFVDRGGQYRSAIFVHGATQRQLAEASKAELQASKRFSKPIVTEIVDAGPFYAAEEYHQDFYKKSPQRYHGYRRGSGRDAFIDRVWGEERNYVPQPPEGAAWRQFVKPTDDVLESELTPLQYSVTQKDGTEAPFRNSFWDTKSAGIYVDIVSGEPLFSSADKFKSGTGWPSFVRPLEPTHIVEHRDRKFGWERVEVRSKYADSHLGHVFNDGPAPTGLRYCINSASLRFIPAERLAAEGYGEYADLLEAGSAR